MNDWLKVTQNAAIACYPWIGRGDKKMADKAAVDSMRSVLNSMHVKGAVVIGEGEMDEAPMLYIGEKVGTCWTHPEKCAYGTQSIDIAVDPLEGTTICANNGQNALSVMAITNAGGFLNAPDIYMDKIIVGKELKGFININHTIKENLSNIVDRKKCKYEEINVAVLKRERHYDIVEQIRSVGAKVQLLDDGDVAAGIATCMHGMPLDMYIGIGGAPEGVLAAAAVSILGGDMQGRLVFSDDKERKRAQDMGITNLDKKYDLHELAHGEDMIFIATGVTDGYLLKGVKLLEHEKYQTHSMLLCSKTRSLQYIEHIML